LQGIHAAHDRNVCSHKYLSPSPSNNFVNPQLYHSSDVSTSQHWCHTRRQVSQSSSRTSSPIPSDDFLAQSPSTLPPLTFPLTFRLVPCTFEEATAVVVVPPPTSTSSSPAKGKNPTPLLFTGRSLNQFRHLHPRTAKSGRIHPYRIAPSTRRLSSSSASSE